MRTPIAAVAVFCLCAGPLLVGCTKKESNVYVTGADARVQVKAQQGTPEDVNTYDSGTYWSESWWYWTRGIEYTFTKRERIEEAKSREGFLGLTELTTKTHYGDIVIDSTYTFNPITAPLKGSKNLSMSMPKLPQNYEYKEPAQYW